jgi:hypothetical protein
VGAPAAVERDRVTGDAPLVGDESAGDPGAHSSALSGFSA